MDVREAMMEDPHERALVEELVQPRTLLERIYGARFTATVEREVPGTVADDALPAIERRISDSFAMNEEGFGSGVELLLSSRERVEWRVMRRGQTTSGRTVEGVTPTASRIVLHRGPASTRVELVIALGSKWILALAPMAALMLYGVAQKLVYLGVGLVVGAASQWFVRGINANAARARLHGGLRSLPTICDAVADGSRKG